MEALAVRPLRPHGRHRSPVQPPAPQAHSRRRDDAEALQASLADEIDLESLIDTDESLSYRAAGVSAEVLRRLRRGQWSIRAEIDLHGHRVDEARAALALFLKEALRAHLRCVRVVHGKGLGSHGRTPVLKGRVRAWLAQRQEVIAFCQAPPAEGGSGALLVLLRPTGNAPERGD
jgi:DNA-nicking Smr family endonuclease